MGEKRWQAAQMTPGREPAARITVPHVLTKRSQRGCFQVELHGQAMPGSDRGQGKSNLPSRTEGPREMFSLGAAATFLGGMLADLAILVREVGMVSNGKKIGGISTLKLWW